MPLSVIAEFEKPYLAIPVTQAVGANGYLLVIARESKSFWIKVRLFAILNNVKAFANPADSSAGLSWYKLQKLRGRDNEQFLPIIVGGYDQKMLERVRKSELENDKVFELKVEETFARAVENQNSIFQGNSDKVIGYGSATKLNLAEIMFLLLGGSHFRVNVSIFMIPRPEASRVEEGRLPYHRAGRSRAIVSGSVVNPELVGCEESDSVARR